MKGLLPLITTLLTGLSSGLFYAWAVSVIPGTKRISDMAYIETMQSINRAILNPWFLLIFLGPLLFSGLAAYQKFQIGETEWFALILISGIIYLVGTIGVTALGNVPLNDALDKVVLQAQDSTSLHEIRVTYETKWNRLHLIRTIFSVLAFFINLMTPIFLKNFQHTINF